MNNPDLTAFYNVVEEGIIGYLGGYESAEIYFETHSLNDLWVFTEKKYNDGWSTDKVARVWYALYAYGAEKEAANVDLADYADEAYTDEAYADDEYHWNNGFWVPKKYKRKYGKAEKASGWKRLPVVA